MTLYYVTARALNRYLLGIFHGEPHWTEDPAEAKPYRNLNHAKNDAVRVAGNVIDEGGYIIYVSKNR